MRGRFLCALVCAAVAGTLVPDALAQSSDARTPAAVFRSSVDVVPVAVVVRDRRGRVVRDLHVSDFEVFDKGERRRILSFVNGNDGPVSLALLVDVSGSMRVAASRASSLAVVSHLLSSLRQGDEASLFTFDRGLSQDHPFTSDWRGVRQALERVEPFGSTSLYDAIAKTARHLEVLRNKRRAIVVITDGLDNASRMTPAEVSGIASASDLPVYVLAVVSPVDVPESRVGQVGAGATGLLRNLAIWTGGDAFVVSSPDGMLEASRALLNDLRNQYVLAIEASGSKGWRPLDVRTRRRELLVRARSGYFAASRELGDETQDNGNGIGERGVRPGS